MQSFVLLFFGLVSAQQATAEFNFYAKYEEASVTTTLGIPDQCLSALNQTVDCDAVNVARAASGADDDFWFKDNVTSLCTAECSSALSTWLSDVETQCAGHQINTDGRFIEPYTIPLRYIAGFDMACLQDSFNNWCYLESQGWESVGNSKWGSDLCYGDDPPPQCDDQVLMIADATADPDRMSVTNMYSKDLFCSECFILMWRQRLLSPVLSSAKLAEYLVDQFNKINSACSDLPGAAPAVFGTNEEPTPNEKRAHGVYNEAATPAVPVHPGAIGDCGQYYHVATGDTCGSIASNLGISIYDIKRFNTELDRTCSNLLADHVICIAPIENEPISTDGNCGVGYGTVCEGSEFGSCCHSNNRCGPCNMGDTGPEDASPIDTTPDYLAPDDSAPGITDPADPSTPIPAPDDSMPSSTTSSITSSITPPSDSAQDDSATGDPTSAKPSQPTETGRPGNTTMSISIDGKCSLNVSCTGSGYGSCCSTSGYCGTGYEWCGVGNCLAGACEQDKSGISFDGTCGPRSPENRTCFGSRFGDCCSLSGYCGTGPEWCGYGNCHSGACDRSLNGVSTDGTCGPKFPGNMTCMGSSYGECCSTQGFCGSSSRHCGAASCYSGKCEDSNKDEDDKVQDDPEQDDAGGEDKLEEDKDFEDRDEDADAVED
ncbi:uncharacterized protein BDCG_09058 [Blastomyces dermatitidis ER-3]|uniref:LysM domain-containing protein n=1 Tax=Ajellomyces dermatitidis (strain ER-3 / ATCC MYA-2586) TaxID=559297 RepID=A0ABM9YGB8_AJEDR|nr:uncharacterized protein BDCG_09058 [Blastomyces dermatitidis ER-3]EEQ85789.2 hypothetical protein BDCG_09058 [Blastomyces dermatitidis ER-3]